MNSDKINCFPAITVVMAVYNADKFVNKAIDSVLGQTYQNWKLICVDDGSTDNSLNILLEYQKRDSRIKVISKVNGGPASARAEAYKIVDTPYVVSLDADDVFSDDLLYHEAKVAYETQADAVAPNFLSQHADGHYSDWNRDNNLVIGQCMSGMDAFKRLFISPSMHGCNLWRSELIKKYATNEDVLYNNFNSDEYIQRLLFLNCKKVVISKGAYIYNYNGNSITKKFTIRHLGYFQTCRKYVDMIKEYCIDDLTSDIIKEYYFRHVIHLHIRYYKDSKKMEEKDRKFIKRTLKESYKDAIIYKSSIHFREKKMPWLYRFVSTNGYGLFDFTCKIMSTR